MKLLQEQFDSMLKASCAVDISRNQYNDLRKAFMAGAAAFYHIQMTMIDEGDEPTEMDMRMMRSLHAELSEFSDSVRAGKA